MNCMEATMRQAGTSARGSMYPEEYVCWSRMQAEAGQTLDAIIARKEMERVAGCGLFVWGIGNPPAALSRVLARGQVPVQVVFSIMKSRPKRVDVVPSRVVAWRRYIDCHGVERPLPAHALVLSRGDSARGPKLTHYALMCRSDEPLELRRGEPFDPAAFRNASAAGAPVGASQVTALLRRTGVASCLSDYEANFTAWLTDSYWVRLVDPVELDLRKLQLLTAITGVSFEDWHKSVAAILHESTTTSSLSDALL
jgi:hypothetical protein